MENYYSILGIRSTASIAEIKSAYKKLAKAYHPDKNPGNAAAEEKFKLVNEAYHTLSDATKRARFDYQFQKSTTRNRTPNRSETRNRTTRPYRQPPQHEQHYKVDKSYFRTQGLTLLVFIIIAGLCLMIAQGVQYLSDLKKTEQTNTVTKALNKVDTLFSSGKMKEAFSSLQRLQENTIIDSRIGYTLDSLINELRNRGKAKYESHQFAEAVTDYLILSEYEDPKQFETMLKIAQCQYALGNYNEAVTALKQIEKERPNDLQLIYEISLIYLNNLHNAQEALQYLSKGKLLIRQTSVKKDDPSFTFELNPDDTPEVYFEIFEARAEANLVLNNFDAAIEDCDLAIYLRPDQGKPYKLKAMSNIGNNRFEMVCSDLRKAKERGVESTVELEKEYCDSLF